MEFIANIYLLFLCLLILCLVVQLLFFWIFFARFSFYGQKNREAKSYPPASVIICAKNESHYLQQFLHNILSQEYPDYELILVNDNSKDESEGILREMQHYHKNLQIINVSTQLKSETDKRLALAVGIKSAKNDLVLLTDADCCPDSSHWITEMVRCRLQKESIVLGYCSYGQKKGLFNKLISFDVFYTAICYFSFALAKKPYMGMGKNILFSKKLFLDNANYLSAYKVNAGGNDIMISDMAKNAAVSVSYGKKSKMTSFRPYESFSHWLKEKKKKHAADKHYKFVNKFFLRLYGITGFLFYVLLIMLLVSAHNDPFYLTVFAAMYLLRMISQWIIFAKSCNKLKEKKLIKYIPIFDLFFTLVMPFVRGILLFKRKSEWK